MVSDLSKRRNGVLMPSVGNLYGSAPLELVRGEGCSVWDSDGREYLDLLCGVGVTSLGHCHPRVVEAARRQLETLQHTTTLFLTEPMVAVAEKLLGVVPRGLSRVFFCVDGSGAVEGALVAARRATSRPNFLSFDLSLHGRTSLSMATTGLGFWQSDPFPPPVVHHVPTPTRGDLEGSLKALDDFLGDVDLSRCAAFIVEPVLGNGGVIVPPAGYLGALKARLEAHGILLIADEVQSGLCRTGRWFGIEHEGIVPDLLCVSKALANGLPAAAWLCREEIAEVMTSPTASTFGGNLVCMAAALATLDVMEQLGLAECARIRGRQFMEGLEGLCTAFPEVMGAPRGRGLMIGVPVVGGAGELDWLLGRLRELGVIAGKCGKSRDVLLLEPALIISESQVDQALSAMRHAMTAMTCREGLS